MIIKSVFRKSLLWKWPLLGTGALLLALTIGVLIAGQISAHLGSTGTGVIHSCVNDSSGTIQIVEPNEECKTEWNPLDWRIAAPSGQVGFFDLATCPAEWTELTGARGRTLVGLPSGGTLGGTVGSLLSDLENRTHTHDVDPASVNSGAVAAHTHGVDPASVNSGAVGSHTHGVDPPNTSTSTATGPTEKIKHEVDDNRNYIGNHSHTVDIGLFNSGGAGAHNHTVDIPNTNSSGAGGHDHTVDVGNTTSTTASTSQVMPYMQLLVCRKD